MISSWAGMKLMEAPSVEFSCWRLCSMEKAAQSCWAFHTRLGDQMARAKPAPAQGHGPSMVRPRPEASRPTARPTKRKATLYLLRSPIPATAPMASHHRGSPVRSSRRSNRVIADQKNRSKAVVDRRCIAASTSAEVAAASAASACASTAASELACHQAREHDGGPTGQRGEDPKPDKRRPEHCGRQSSHGRREWWLVDIAPGEVAGAGQKVQLVAVVSVATSDGQLECNQPSGEAEHRAEIQLRQTRATVVGGRSALTRLVVVVMSSARSARSTRTG